MRNLLHIPLFLSLVGVAESAEFRPVALNEVHDVSADGRIVVGAASNPDYPFYSTWAAISRDGVMEFAPVTDDLRRHVGDKGLRAAAATSVSADGRLVAGTFTFSGFDIDHLDVGFGWNPYTGATQVVGAATAGGRKAVLDVSADGSVAVGYGRIIDGITISSILPAAWDDSGEIVGLTGAPEGKLPAFDIFLLSGNRATAVSPDGSRIVGQLTYRESSPTIAEGIPATTAVLWERVGTRVKTTALGDLPGGNYIEWGDFFGPLSEALAISDDGRTVVGWGTSDSGTEAFLWTEAAGMIGLGDLPGMRFFSEATGVSADGKYVIGRSVGEEGLTAFLWDEQHGMRKLADVLAAQGVDMTDWTLSEATAIAGPYLVGHGRYQLRDQAWIAKLDFVPEPASLRLAAIAAVLGLAVRCGKRRRGG